MRIIKSHLFIFAVIGIYFVLSTIFGITCPIKYIVKVPCPTCGMTRAMISLIRLDFKGYVEYNFMAFFMIIAVILLIHRKVFKKTKWIDWYSMLVLATNMLIYFICIV